MSCALKITAAALLLSLLGGCGSTVIMHDQGQPLAPDEIVVLTKVRAAYAGKLGLSTEGLGAGRTVLLTEGDNFLALRLKNGRTYTVTRYEFGQYVVYFENPIEFTLTSDAMIYIGDIYLSGKYSKIAGLGQLVGMQAIVSDNEIETIKKLKQKYATAFENYRYQKILAQ